MQAPPVKTLTENKRGIVKSNVNHAKQHPRQEGTH